MSSSRENVELMIGFLAAVLRSDEQALAAAPEPAVVWHAIRPEWNCEGPSPVARTFLDARETQADIESIELIGAPRHVTVRVRRRAPVRYPHQRDCDRCTSWCGEGVAETG